jgi:type IV pilus assembly protein PilO
VKGNRVRTVTILSVVALVGITALAWFLLIGPRLAEADEISAQVEQSETGNLQLRNRVNQARTQVAQAPAAAAEAQKLFATMPQAAELPTVLRQITEAAQAAGIDPAAIQVISTAVPIATGVAAQGASGVSLAEMDIGITVSGNRQSLLDFLDNLQALDRAFLITATQVSGAALNDPAAGESLTMRGTMFVLQSELPDLVATVESLIAEADAAAPAGEG